MTNLYRPIGGVVPSMTRSEIVAFLQQADFFVLDPEPAASSSFLTSFTALGFNGCTLFGRYTCRDREQLRRCFAWMGYEVLKNDHMKYRNYAVNPIIFALLNNPSLTSIKDIYGEAEFTTLAPEYKQDIDFAKINFAEISPYEFDGELTELALRGSVCAKWKLPALRTKQLTFEFTTQIMQGRFADFKVYRTMECWRGYILGFFIAYFLFDSERGEFWILSKDDYD